MTPTILCKPPNPFPWDSGCTSKPPPTFWIGGICFKYHPGRNLMASNFLKQILPTQKLWQRLMSCFFIGKPDQKLIWMLTKMKIQVASTKNIRYTSDLCILSEKEIVPPWNPIFYGDWIPPESAPLHGFCGYDSVGHLRKKRNNLRRIRKVWWRASISNLLLRVVTGSKWHLSSIKIFHEIPGGFPVANFHQIDSGWGWSITWVFVCGYLPNVPNVNDVNLNMNGDHGGPQS